MQTMEPLTPTMTTTKTMTATRNTTMTEIKTEIDEQILWLFRVERPGQCTPSPYHVPKKLIRGRSQAHKAQLLKHLIECRARQLWAQRTAEQT